MVTGSGSPVTVPISHQIARKNRFDVTRTFSKVFRLVHTKRKLPDENYDSTPFGFQRFCNRISFFSLLPVPSIFMLSGWRVEDLRDALPVCAAELLEYELKTAGYESDFFKNM